MADQKMSHENDRKLDEMLDAMLSAYSAVEPRPGLETRILANVKEQAVKNSARWGLRWTWGVAALAVVGLIMMAIYVSRLQTQHVEPQLTAHPLQPTNSAPALQTKSLTTPKVTARSTRRQRTQIARALPPAASQMIAVRQEVFPSPSPLSEQEKLLLRYVTRTPREELIAQSRPDPPDEMDDSDSDDNRPQKLTQIPQRSSNTR